MGFTPLLEGKISSLIRNFMETTKRKAGLSLGQPPDQTKIRMWSIRTPKQRLKSAKIKGRPKSVGSNDIQHQ